jgi:hypothetical protein
MGCHYENETIKECSKFNTDELFSVVWCKKITFEIESDFGKLKRKRKTQRNLQYIIRR